MLGSRRRSSAVPMVRRDVVTFERGRASCDDDDDDDDDKE